MLSARISLDPLSLHDALPIFGSVPSKLPSRTRDGRLAGSAECPLLLAAEQSLAQTLAGDVEELPQQPRAKRLSQDRKSTRLNSSHRCISYAVFCLKKKNYNIK